MSKIEFQVFRSMDELNRFVGDGRFVEILFFQYDVKEGVHYLYYRLNN